MEKQTRHCNNRKNEVECINKVINLLSTEKLWKNGRANCDPSVIKVMFKSAYQNKDQNSFPDFLFPKGIIEHFTVTSSNPLNNNGSDYKRSDSINCKEDQEYFKEKDREFLNEPFHGNSIISVKKEHIIEGGTYENFINSFKRTCLAHLDSLRKYNHNKKISVFLIEQDDSRLFIPTNTYPPVTFYNISDDKELLQWIKANLNEVAFIAFVAVDSVEIIELSLINRLIENSQTQTNVHGGRKRNIRNRVYVNLDKFV